MATSDKSQLLDMGFAEDRVEWALKATKNAGLQPALDHIIANMDSAVPPADAQASPSGNNGASEDDDDDDDAEALKAHIAKMKAGGDTTAGNGEQFARSVKCSECGKIFKNADLVSFHAEKSGHSNFEESTEEYVPLTEEEKKQKLEELRIKLAEKRAKQADLSVEENKANEKLRRRAGQDSASIRQQLAIKEMEKEAAAKKKEKLDDARAKAAIRAQIEADKKARAEKAARDKAIREGRDVPMTAADGAVAMAGTGAARAAAAASGAGVKGSEYKETRLQVRLSTGGQPLVKAFNSDAPLSEVAEWIASENLKYDASSVKMSTTFPRKTFTPADMGKSLRENGLTPSAVLMASPL
ncbi:hypothetical protein QFC21_007075 [Naganishia friedmannii]|uniref:Uncharacterized protein n=2 Tax=Naganishia friedmannii TaxID=89922 RepID=A0ACC2UZU2_9TREE|nr:hypothetical protein QFC21_007279 [Naganishia friedmannii]KAJ9091877.1 hypothetical protein QFC21_007075 [Naganishia friedmannii]